MIHFVRSAYMRGVIDGYVAGQCFLLLVIGLFHSGRGPR